MSKHIKLQQNIYNTYLALKSHKKQQDFLEKCFVFAWEGKEIETKDDVVSIAFLAVKPSLKITETSENWGGSRDGSGKKHNQDDNQLDNQDETKSKSSSNQVSCKNKDISNKIKEIHKENNQYGECGLVLLTEEQHSSLVKKYENIDKAIEELDTWLSKDSKNAEKYVGKNHYGFFKSNSWVWSNVGGCVPKKKEIDKSSEEYHQYLLAKKRPQDVVDFVDGVWDIIPF